MSIDSSIAKIELWILEKARKIGKPTPESTKIYNDTKKELKEVINKHG